LVSPDLYSAGGTLLAHDDPAISKSKYVNPTITGAISGPLKLAQKDGTFLTAAFFECVRYTEK
jgi:hypothetical protein